MAVERSIIERIVEKYWPATDKPGDIDVWDNLVGMTERPPSADMDKKAKIVDFYATKIKEDSFIYQVTKNNIFISDIEPLSIDEPLGKPVGDPTANEVGDWYYYVFDWRNYQNVNSAAKEYSYTDPLSEHFEELTKRSLYYAVQLWGRQHNPGKFNKDNVKFGQFEVDTRVDPHVGAPDDHLSKVNPGLTFLIGMKKSVVNELRAVPRKFSMEALDPTKAILVRIDSIDEEFNKIAKTLEIYHGIREELEEPFTVIPWAFDFKEEADRVRKFKSALKSLLQRASDGSAVLPNTEPEHLSVNELEDWARYPELWNKPGNLIEIGVTKKTANYSGAYEVAYVREYAPEITFRKGLNTVSGIVGARLLGPVKDHRIIGGGFSPSLRKDYASFQKEPGVRHPRTVALISGMHGSNGFNEGIKTKFNLNPQLGTPNLNIFKFISDMVYPLTAEQGGPSKTSTTHGDEVAYQKATDAFLQKHGGSIASSAQRSLAGARSNNPSWAERYDYYSGHAIVDMTDNFFASLPEKVDRLRISEGAPYGLDVIFNEVLNQADVRRLVLEIIKCALDPDEWLELLCRYAMKELGVDTWFEAMATDGTFDKLRSAAEVSSQVTDSFNTIEAQKRINQGHYNELNDEREKYNSQILSLVNRREELNTELSITDNLLVQNDLQQKLKVINYDIESAMGRRQQVEMDSMITYSNQSAGSWIPLPIGGSPTAAAAAGVTDAIMSLEDPNLMKEICANIISYSIKAVEALIALYKSIAALFEYDPDAPVFNFKQPNMPKMQTDNIGMYIVELLRAALAQALHTVVLFFVKKILTTLLDACNLMWDALYGLFEDPEDDNKVNKIPGQARFDDLLAQTPTKAARDLAMKLVTFIDVTDPDVVSDLLGLMEDLELLLSQIELCSLTKGQASIKVLKIVKNLIKIRYNKFYLSLKGNSESLSFAKITDFFKEFEPLIKAGYCEEIQQPGPQLQLYQECPPYVRTVCGDLLIGHCTNDQIDNICKRAKAERLEKLMELIDIGWNPEYTAIDNPRDCNSPNAIPHDVYPTNAINAKLMEQNFRPIVGAFRGEVFSFSNKLLTGEANVVAKLSKGAIEKASKLYSSDNEVKIGRNADGTISGSLPSEFKKITKILPVIKDSLNNPMGWYPNTNNSNIMSDFYVGLASGTQEIHYYITDNNNYPQAIELWYANYLGKFKQSENKWIPFKQSENKWITYPIKSGKVVFLPVARMESFLNLWGPTAVFVKDGVLNVKELIDPKEATTHTILNPNPPLTSEAWGDFTFYTSPLAEKFYEEINKAWPEAPDGSGYPSSLVDSKKGLKFVFNTLTRDIGNHIFNKIRSSDIFQTKGIENLTIFFRNFFPVEAFSADESCNIIEATLLKVGKIKEYVKERDKSLTCKALPDLNEETPNLARAQAEGTILILAKICAFETVLRLLPISSSIKIKEMLSSEPIVNVIIENLLYELAMLDYDQTHNTLSEADARTEQQMKPAAFGGKNRNRPDSGFLDMSPLGNFRYGEEPPTPAVPGREFKPKFPAHVVYYANRIMYARAMKNIKEGKILIDPITEENIYGQDVIDKYNFAPFEGKYINSPDYLPFSNPYGLDGLAFLIKEQMVPMGDFIEREFEPLFADMGIKRFEQFVLELFFHKEAYKHNIDKDPFGDTSPHAIPFDLMPRANKIEKNDKLTMWVEEKFYTSLVNDGLSDFTTDSGLERGGFLLEPYIRVKQNKKIKPEDIAFNVVDETKIKETLAAEAYKNVIQSDPAKSEYVKEQCGVPEFVGLPNPNWPECAHIALQQEAQKAYDEVISADISELIISADDSTELNPLFGDLSAPRGAYININQWTSNMAGKSEFNDPLKLHLNPTIASDPHTNWFDPWMYGLRLVYVAPIPGPHGKNIIQSDNEVLSMENINEDVLKGFKQFEAIAEDINDPWGIESKKAYILTEAPGPGGSPTGAPIFTVPLIEIEIPVGSLMSDEKEFAKSLVIEEAEQQGIDPEIAGNDFMEKINSVVPLGYFTYQAEEDDYPVEQLLCAMTETAQFKRLFGDINKKLLVDEEGGEIHPTFPLENYKTLLGLHVLVKTFRLNEYKESNFGLFKSTKAQLRNVFYSNTLAHDHTKGASSGPTAMTQAAAAQLNEEELNFLNLMLGNPPNLALIFAMTPIAILKGLVTLIDPKWADFPWTVPGLIMFLLNMEFGDDMSSWIKDEEQKKPKAIDCPETGIQRSAALYTDEELEFVEMMKSFGVPEGDRDYILNVGYPTTRPDHIVEASGNGLNNEPGLVENFKDTPLFNVLVGENGGAWKSRTDDELTKLQIIFNNLREYYDAYVEVNTMFFSHFKNYYKHSRALFVDPVYYEDEEGGGYWNAKSGFEEILFISCSEIDSPRYDKERAMAETVCENQYNYNLAIKPLSAFDELFNTILKQIDLSYTPYGDKSLITPLEMFKRAWLSQNDADDRVPLLSSVKAYGYGELISDFEEITEQKITELLEEAGSEGDATPAPAFLSGPALAEKIADVLMILVWNNDKLFELENHNKGIAMSGFARYHWHNRPDHLVDFNTINGQDLRGFWKTKDLLTTLMTSQNSWHGMLGDWRKDHPDVIGADPALYQPHWVFPEVDPLFDLKWLNGNHNDFHLLYGSFPNNADSKYNVPAHAGNGNFSYAESVVGYHVDALAKDPGDDLEGNWMNTMVTDQDAHNHLDLARQSIAKAKAAEKEAQEYINNADPAAQAYAAEFLAEAAGHYADSAAEKAAAKLIFQGYLDQFETFDMKNPDDYSKIGQYWVDSWANPYAIKKRVDWNTDEVNMAKDYPEPANEWQFIDLRMKSKFAEGIYKKGLVLDHIAWYYPTLASVIAELLYKVHNITLQTPCIRVSETPSTSVEGEWEVVINIITPTPMPSTFNVNKKAIVDDLNSGRFVF